MMTHETVALTHAQKKYLRTLGHGLSPVVYIGKEGLSEAVVAAIDEALDSHELIKIKLINTENISKHDAADKVPELAKAQLVQLIGKTLLVYRRNRNKKRGEQIPLPRK
jgi:RNA-binding protein